MLQRAREAQWKVVLSAPAEPLTPDPSPVKGKGEGVRPSPVKGNGGEASAAVALILQRRADFCGDDLELDGGDHRAARRT